MNPRRLPDLYVLNGTGSYARESISARNTDFNVGRPK